MVDGEKYGGVKHVGGNKTRDTPNLYPPALHEGAVPDIQVRERLGSGQGRPETDQGSAESASTKLEVTSKRRNL